MATVFRLRYIYAGSRLIFVEQPDSDKYRIVHSDLVLGQSLVGFISPDSRFSGSQTGITLGSATETRTYEDPLFAEMQGRILIPHTAIGYAHISRFVSVSRGLALNHAAGPLNTETKLAEVKDKLTTPSTAELINTRTKLTGAKEKILAEQKNKTFETSDPKFSGSSTGAAFGQSNATFKTEDNAFGGSATGVTMSHTADAYVEQPIMIPAGEYTGRTNIDVSSLSSFSLDINLTYAIGYDNPITRHAFHVEFWAYPNYAGMSAQWGEGEEDYDTLAMIFPGGSDMDVYTNTDTFTVDNNTAVSQTILNNFYRCFQSV